MNCLLFASIILAQTTEPVGVPAWVPLVIGVIVLLLFWWGLSRNSVQQGAAEHEENHHDSPDDHHEVAAEADVPEDALLTGEEDVETKAV